jgi:hypothetical protein
LLGLRFCALTQGAWDELSSKSAFPSLKKLFLHSTRISGAGYISSERARRLRKEAKARFGTDTLDVKQCSERISGPDCQHWWQK